MVFRQPAKVIVGKLSEILTYMGSLVNFEPSRSRVALSADITDERLVARVDQLVSLQVAFCDEAFTAVIISALKRSFAGLVQLVI
jgi:hypothetical protein